MPRDEVGPGEDGVVDRAILGRHRLAVDHAEEAHPPAVQRGRRAYGRPRGRFLLERPCTRTRHREPVLADPPDVDREHEDEQPGQHRDMERVEAQQRALPDLLATDEQVLQRSANTGT